VLKELKVRHRVHKVTLVLQGLQDHKGLKEPLKVHKELQGLKEYKVLKVLKEEYKVLKVL
jgi:predicted aldo/keto reductase-like oxidoreductase